MTTPRVYARVPALAALALAVSILFWPDAGFAQRRNSSSPANACTTCPQGSYCPTNSEAASALADKKQQARWAGIPERLIDLFDQLPPCAACISAAPDLPTIYINYDLDKYRAKYGRLPSYTSHAWSRQSENIARNDSRAGLITSFTLALGQIGMTCNCCGQGETGRSPGKEASITYTSTSLGPDPKDLTELPTASRPPVVPPPQGIGPQALPPPTLVAACDKCKSLVDQYKAKVAEYNTQAAMVAQALRAVMIAEQALEQAEWDEHFAAELANTEQARKVFADAGRRVTAMISDLAKDRARYKTEAGKLSTIKAAMDDLLAQIAECQKKCNEPQATGQQLNPVGAGASTNNNKVGTGVAGAGAAVTSQPDIAANATGESQAAVSGAANGDANSAGRISGRLSAALRLCLYRRHLRVRLRWNAQGQQ